jgi:hypothetical protein
MEPKLTTKSKIRPLCKRNDSYGIFAQQQFVAEVGAKVANRHVFAFKWSATVVLN